MYNIFRSLTGFFVCFSVHRLSSQQCQSASSPIEVTTTMSLASDHVVQSGCATSRVRFSARSGQHLNISIIDFTSESHLDVTRTCNNYMQLRDVSIGQPFPVCASSPRERHVMTSEGHEVEVDFEIHDEETQKFLLRIEGDVITLQSMNVVRIGFPSM